MDWARECGAPAIGCRNCAAPVAGSDGVTARCACLAARTDCPVRFKRAAPQLGELGGCTIVAGCGLDRLRGRRLAELYDVLPAIAESEWDVIVKFARDYTARRIPWAVIRRGDVYAMIKLKG